MELVKILLEIIKITVPALIVFFTVYYLMKKHLDSQLQLKSLELQQEKVMKGGPLKLQACERLSLFLERINPPNLILRIRTATMSSQDLMTAMLIAIQHEYEHNISQQIYVSDNLWEIIMLARQNVNNLVTMAAASVGENAGQNEFVDKIFQILDQEHGDFIKTAQNSIRKEASLLI